MLDRPFVPAVVSFNDVDHDKYVKWSGRIKLVDFGFARSAYTPCRNTPFRRMQNMFANTCCGTYTYSSPELLVNRGPYNPQMNDLWGFGVMLFEMLTGKLPWNENNAKRLLYLQQKGVTWPDPSKTRKNRREFTPISNEAKDLVNCILQYNIGERFIMKDVVYHPWIYRKYVRYEGTRLGDLCSKPLINQKTNNVPPGTEPLKEFQMWGDDYLVRQYKVGISAANRVLYYHNMYMKYRHIGIDGNTSEGQDPDIVLGLLRPAKDDLHPPIPRMCRTIQSWPSEFLHIPCVPSNPYNLASSGDLKPLLIASIELLYKVQQTNLRNASSIQDLMTLLQALIYRTGCADWPNILKGVCVAVHEAIYVINETYELLKHQIEQTRKTMMQVSFQQQVYKQETSFYENCLEFLSSKLLNTLHPILDTLFRDFPKEIQFKLADYEKYKTYQSTLIGGYPCIKTMIPDNSCDPDRTYSTYPMNLQQASAQEPERVSKRLSAFSKQNKEKSVKKEMQDFHKTKINKQKWTMNFNAKQSTQTLSPPHSADKNTSYQMITSAIVHIEPEPEKKQEQMK